MRETYYIGAYWGARGDSVSACADRLAQMLMELEACHELLALWIRGGSSFRNAQKRKLEPRREVLAPLFKACDLKDPQGLGYLCSIWNAQIDRDKHISARITCGKGPERSGLSNVVVIDLPNPSGANTILYQPDVLLSAVRAVVRAWDPDWSVVMSRAHRNMITDPDNPKPEGKPYVGWMTYLRNKRLGGLAGTPSRELPCEVEDVPGHGSIFVVTRDHRFSVANPDDIECVQALTAYLEAHGALVPIPTNQPH